MSKNTVSKRTAHCLAFEPKHLKDALLLSQQAQWPHRLEDWSLTLSLSQGLVALDAETSQVVGTVLMTPYGEDAATVNMVIVDEGWRGQGLGRRLMDEAMALAGARPLRLTATREGLPLYEKLGFREVGMVLQHQGEGGPVPPFAAEDVAPAAADDHAVIAALDRQAFGADRSLLLDRFAEVGSFTLLRRNGAAVGFAALRDFGRGQVIGPVVAPDAEGAKALIGPIIAAHPGKFLRVDTTAGTGLGPWLADCGLRHVGGGVAMRRPAPATAAQPSAPVSTFALASQALG
ncbi:GNAT family N-acetyltransferase (plasmid) [Azospirillum humicireducens]|uniref:GNAT family N-acetyltransferase n=1 Tax=Azospirillum humicireducens TaxID=1226968 RepID=A0A2R4VRL8_9PROT|nr:GNAT family N-acetyltransferase [Azospirillum humicireducens]AWB07093.1 GNAT family N-acetyltransferase [Azospirillum humicireducens]